HRLGSALVEAARGGDAAARVPAPALAVLVDGEVRAAFVEMDRRPQPEELGWHARDTALGFPDGTHAPRTIARAGRAIGEDGDLLVAEADVPLPEPELGEAGEIHQHPALGPVREARLLDRAGAGVEGEISGEPEVVVAHPQMERTQRLEHLHEDRADPRVAAV